MKSEKRNSSLTGNAYVQELLASENLDRVDRILRMPKETFLDLVELLKKKNLLADTRTNVTVERQLLQFLHIVAGMTTDQVSERFQFSMLQ